MKTLSPLLFPFLLFLFLFLIDPSSLKLNKRQQYLEQQVLEDEAHLQEPYLGGYNSDRAQMMQVTFV